MTEENKTASGTAGGTAAPGQNPPPPAPGTPPPAPAPPAAGEPAEVRMTSDALKARLADERAKERKSWLKEHGFADEEAFKSHLKVSKELADAKLSEDERVKKQLKELEPKAARADLLEARMKKDVETRFAALPEDVQKRIDAEADGDWEKRDAFMRVLGPAASAGATAATEKPKAAAPANTTTAPPAPPNTTAPTAFEKYQELQKTDPMGASIFFSCNQLEIQRTTPAPTQ